jgi:hypothetical protein
MKQNFGSTGDNGSNSNYTLLFILLAIVLGSTLVKSTSRYRKYQMVLVAVIVGLIIYTYTKNKFADAVVRTNTQEGNIVNTTEVLLVINMTPSTTLTWVSSIGSNSWKTVAQNGGLAALSNIKNIPPKSYQLHNYDPNFSVETFFNDSNTTYKNNNADLAYVIYDLTTYTDPATQAAKYNMHIAFASLNNCPGCSGIINALNLSGDGYSGANYPMYCEKPRHNATRLEFEDGAGSTVTYTTTACPAGPTSPNIIYINALPSSVTIAGLSKSAGTIVFQKAYPESAPFVTVDLAVGGTTAMSSLYSTSGSAIDPTVKPPKFLFPPENDTTFIYNRYKGLLIESIAPTVASNSTISSTNKRIVTYRSISSL